MNKVSESCNQFDYLLFHNMNFTKWKSNVRLDLKVLLFGDHYIRRPLINLFAWA